MSKKQPNPEPPKGSVKPLPPPAPPSKKVAGSVVNENTLIQTDVSIYILKK